MAGDEDRQRVGAASLPDGLGRGADRAGQITVAACFAQRNGRHFAADLFLQALAPVKRQVKARQAFVEIGLQLGGGFLQQARAFPRLFPPRQRAEHLCALVQRHGAEWGLHHALHPLTPKGAKASRSMAAMPSTAGLDPRGLRRRMTRA